MKKTVYFSFLCLLVLIWACRKDFIVENIDKKTITVNAPTENAVTTINLVTFWWEPLDGAELYNLQIVRPSFANAAQLLLDTNITKTKFNFNLKPGTYQWRLKATNAGHATVFQTYNLRIDTTSDLTEQSVNLISPVNASFTGNKTITFTWGSITVAKKYQIQISNGVNTIFDTLLTGKTSLTKTLLAAANATTAFSWNVRAFNDNTQTQYNASSFTVTIDLKGPSTPVLTSPSSGTLVLTTDSLKWNRASDALYDTVYVSNDTTLLTNVIKLRVGLGQAVISDFGLTPVNPGLLYGWRVRSFDVFGNSSSYSLIRKFKF